MATRGRGEGSIRKLGDRWQVRISTGEGLEPFPVGGWAAIALGALSVAWRTGPPLRRAADRG